MKEEYRTAIEKIALSDNDKARILANVLKTCGNAAELPSGDDSGESIAAHSGLAERSLRFSPKRIGAVAAAFIVLCVSVVLIRNQFITLDQDYHKDGPVSPVTTGAAEEVVWEELDSVEEIARKTDCKTYTLANLSKRYKVKKVQVANAQKHVKITYQKKKQKEDKIYFEYKEEIDSDEVKSQFSEEAELATENIDGADVKMYGKKKCSAMTWEESDCTFAVKMSKACSTDNARRIVSGAKEEKKEDKQDKDEKEPEKSQRLVNSNIVGWDGTEQESSAGERKKVLQKVYDNLGFRVILNHPAVEVTYKLVGDYESFAFYYDGDEMLEDNWIIGYAGTGGSPDGTKTDYDEVGSISVGNVMVELYQRDGDEKLLVFTQEEICFTLFLDEYDEDIAPDFLSGLLSVFQISFQDESDEEEGPQSTAAPEDGSDPDSDPEEGTGSDSGTDSYKAAQQLQEIVAARSLKKLASYINYPLDITGLGITVNSRTEFMRLDARKIFTSEWVDAILFCDIERIKPKTKSFTLGDSDNSLVCRVKDGEVVVQELHVVADDMEEEDSDMEEPGEDDVWEDLEE